MSKPIITVLGEAGLEVHCSLERTLSHREPNPGLIYTSFGGGGYTLTKNLNQLGIDSKLVTVFGQDRNGRDVQEDLRGSNVNTEGSLVGELPTPTTVMLWDEQGLPSLNVYDTRILDQMTPAYLEERLGILKNSTALFFDANLSRESIQYLVENVDLPLFATGVSAGKCMRLIPVLNKLFGIRLNLLEARRVTGKIHPSECARELCKKGIKLVIISLGAEGVMAASGKDTYLAAARKGKVVSPIGEQDAVSAALMWGFLHRLRLKDIAESAVAAAALAKMSESAVNPDLTEAFLLADLEERMSHNIDY